MKPDDYIIPSVMIGFIVGVVVLLLGQSVYGSGVDAGKNFCISHPSECQPSPLHNIFGLEIKK